MSINDILILLFVSYIMSVAMFVGVLKNKKIWNWCLVFPMFYLCYFLVITMQNLKNISQTLLMLIFIVGLIAIALNIASISIVVSMVNRKNSIEYLSEVEEKILNNDLSEEKSITNNVKSVEGKIDSNEITKHEEKQITTNIENNEEVANAHNKTANTKFITKSLKWFILGCIIATKDRNNNTKTGKIDRYGNISIQDNSNRGSFVVRPCGKCSSVSGEKPLDFTFGFKPLKKLFVCCGGFSGFSFTGGDIANYKLISSNAKSERYELQHINGKKILLNCNPVGSELLNAILGSEKLIA